MANALEVKGLGVRFSRRPVLSGVSFAVPEGDTLAVIGPNGSGKTILFKALIGAVRTEGTVRWAPGTRIGYVPQKLDIERDLPITGIDFLRAKAVVSRGAESDVPRALAMVNLRRLDLMYLLGFALTVALGLRYLGVLLMGSLIIIPATTARHLARSLGGMLALATGLSVGSTVLGTLGAPMLHVATGPLVIAIAAAFFLLGLLLRRHT